MGRLSKYHGGMKKRKFNGKTYTSWTKEPNKSAAIAEVKTQRNKGYYARKIKNKDGSWIVYKRRMPKARRKGITKKKF